MGGRKLADLKQRMAHRDADFLDSLECIIADTTAAGPVTHFLEIAEVVRDYCVAGRKPKRKLTQKQKPESDSE